MYKYKIVKGRCLLSEPVAPVSLDYKTLCTLQGQSSEVQESEFYLTESAFEAYTEFKEYRSFLDTVKKGSTVSLYLNYYVLKTFQVTDNLQKELECEVAPLNPL